MAFITIRNSLGSLISHRKLPAKTSTTLPSALVSKAENPEITGKILSLPDDVFVSRGLPDSFERDMEQNLYPAQWIS